MVELGGDLSLATVHHDLLPLPTTRGHFLLQKSATVRIFEWDVIPPSLASTTMLPGSGPSLDEASIE